MSVAIQTSTNRESTEQVKPFAHAIFVEEDEDLSMEIRNKYDHNRTCLKCCGAVSALILILAMVMLILSLTAFHIKDPILNMNSVAIDNSSSTTDRHFTFVESFSVKNPNGGSFVYDRVNTVLYYYYGDGAGGDSVISQATITYHQAGGGVAKAKRTIPVNVTMVVLTKDLRNRGTWGLSSYTEISGKVKILNIIKKHVVVKLNCTMNVDLRNLSVRDQNCKKL